MSTAAGAAGADESPQFKACMTKAEGVTSAMLDCGKAEIDDWDRRMNAAYKTLLQSLADNDRQRLRSEQRTWLKHHLAETKRLASDPDNGSVALLESQSFELSDLSDRTLKLENRVNGKR